MELIDNMARLLGDDLKDTLKPGARLKMAVSCFSMYAFEALKAELEDVTAQICEHIASVYRENFPESIYFLMLYNIFNECLDEIDEDVLPNDRTGYQGTLIWKKLSNNQKDAGTGIINKLETYSGCILASRAARSRLMWSKSSNCCRLATEAKCI